MDTPQTKAELLKEMEIGRQAWDELISSLNDQDLKKSGVVGIWSVKDVLAHMAGYELYMAATFADIKGDQTNGTSMLDAYYQTHLTLYRAEHPDLPEQIAEVRGDQVNEVFVASCRYKLPAEVRALEKQSYLKLLQWVEAFSEAELNHPLADTNKSLLQIVPQQCYLHYKAHMPAIKEWIKQSA